MDRYYVVQTQPQRERVAVQELQNQDFDTFFPIIQHSPRSRRGRLEVPQPSPLFPKYVFVRLDLELDLWRCINGTRGVVRLIQMDDERPSPVPIAAMQRLLDAGEVIQEEVAGLPFNIHDHVEFTEGPMRGLRGVVSLCEKDRVTLLLELLGGRRLVRTQPKFLQYIGVDA